MKRTKNIHKNRFHLPQGRNNNDDVKVAIVGAHQSIYKLHCKEMVDMGGQDLQMKPDQLAGAVIQGV